MCVCLSVCLLTRKVYCGSKTADWIQIPFWAMSGVGRGMGALDGDGDSQRGGGSFEGEFGATHCNRWDWSATRSSQII